jgi:hypothetical protein
MREGEQEPAKLYRLVVATRTVVLRHPSPAWRAEDYGENVVLVSPRGAAYAMPAVGGFIAVCIFLIIWWQTGGPRDPIPLLMIGLAGLSSLAVAIWGFGRGRRVEVGRDDVWRVEEFLWGALQRRTSMHAFRMCLCQVTLGNGLSRPLIGKQKWEGWALCWLTRKWSRAEVIAIYIDPSEQACMEYLQRLPSSVRKRMTEERFKVIGSYSGVL